jgi:CHAD domain-containing protein
MMIKRIESVLAGILTNQLQRIEYNYNGLLNESNPEYLHDLRVAIRRTRFALRLFAPFTDAKKCYKIRELLGVINSESGEVRDLDISIARLNKLFKNKKFNAGSSRKKLFRELFSRQKKARKSMLKAFTHLRYRYVICSINEFIKELKEIKQGPCEDKKISKIINRLAKEHSDKLLKWGKWNIKKLSSKDLHKMRIDFKRARYLMEFFLTCTAAQKDFKRNIAIFASFQDILGKHQDTLAVIKKIKEISEDIGLDKADVGKIVKIEKMRAKKSRTEFENKWQRLLNTTRKK